MFASFSNVCRPLLDQWEAYEARGINQALDLSDKENQFETDEARNHYFAIGKDALRLCMEALLLAGAGIPRRILDMPCGSGRVTRHLAACFPDATIGACDLYAAHTRFCAEEFGATMLSSLEDFDALDLGEWDLVFCGSLLTHLPERLFWPAVRFIARTLAPGGVGLITLEGRRAIEIQESGWKLIDDERFSKARAGFEERGFGFVDYQEDFLKGLFPSQDSYGVTLVAIPWLMKGLMAVEGLRLLGYIEGAWDDHQDVLVIGRWKDRL